jgi:prepilin-type N-terminal cleavage/methylation domain-containing protein
MPFPHCRRASRGQITCCGSQSGFTLIELAISMLIITLLATILLTPITTQITQTRIAQARSELDQINEALIGYALAQAKPRLPCPDTTGDGLEDACPNIFTTQTTGGNIPWATLNVPATDPWGQRYQYRVNNAYTDSAAGFTLTTAPTGAACTPPGGVSGFIKVCADAACASVLANGVPAVIFTRGPNGATAATSADELENLDSDCLFISRTYSSVAGTEFDDLIVWVSPGILMSRMVSAQKLP